MESVQKILLHQTKFLNLNLLEDRKWLREKKWLLFLSFHDKVPSTLIDISFSDSNKNMIECKNNKIGLHLKFSKSISGVVNLGMTKCQIKHKS